MRIFSLCTLATILVLLTACDSNAKPEYGKTGLPKNCRAYVQVAINDYRAKRYTAVEVMDGLERNCGEHGISWAGK
jgi:hypothetical protein